MIPTAEEFCNDIRYVTYSLDEKLITFAKLHVEAALKEASKKAKVKIIQGDFGVFDTRPSVKKNSILNAYPLENIK